MPLALRTWLSRYVLTSLAGVMVVVGIGLIAVDLGSASGGFARALVAAALLVSLLSLTVTAVRAIRGMETSRNYAFAAAAAVFILALAVFFSLFALGTNPLRLLNYPLG